MLTMIDSAAYNCNTAIKIEGDAQIIMEGMDVAKCNTVFEIDSHQQNININANRLNVQDSGEFMAIGQQVTARSTHSSSHTNNNYTPMRTHMMHFESDQQAISRIAHQYVGVKNLIK